MTKPRKGATPAEIKAWVAQQQATATKAEQREYEQTGLDIQRLFAQIGLKQRTEIEVQVEV